MSRKVEIAGALEDILAAPAASHHRAAADEPLAGATHEAPSRSRPSSPARESRHARQSGRAVAVPTAALSVQIDQALLERVRDLVSFESGPPHHLTLRAFVQRALANELERATQQAHADGRLPDEQPVPPRRAALRVGRPLV